MPNYVDEGGQVAKHSDSDQDGVDCDENRIDFCDRGSQVCLLEVELFVVHAQEELVYDAVNVRRNVLIFERRIWHHFETGLVGRRLHSSNG